MATKKRMAAPEDVERRIEAQLKTAESLEDIDMSPLLLLQNAIKQSTKPKYARGAAGELLQLDDRTGGYRELQIGYGVVAGGTKIPSASSREGGQFGVKRRAPVEIHVDPYERDGGHVIHLNEEPAEETPEGKEDVAPEETAPPRDREQEARRIIDNMESDAPNPTAAPAVPAAPAAAPPVDFPRVQVDYTLEGNHQISVMYHKIILTQDGLLVCVRDLRAPASTIFHPAYNPDAPLRVGIPDKEKSFKVLSLNLRFRDGDYEYLLLPLAKETPEEEE